MTTPIGPITFEISLAEPDVVEINQVPPPEFTIANIGPQGPAGAAGEAGEQGIQGPPGEAGAPGTKWFQNNVNPTSEIGEVGDWFVNTSTNDIYEKTNSTTWTFRMNIQGDQGIQGEVGETGEAGPANTLSIGTVTTGTAGSSASASVTGTAPTQSLNLTIPRGDTGSQGIQGIQGPPGTNNTTIVRKSADEQVTSNTTVQDDDHLVIALEANSVYAIDSFLMFDSDATADIKFTFAGPSGSTIAFTSDGISAGNSNNIGSIKMDVNTAGVEAVLGGFIGTKTCIRPAGVIVTAGTAGNIVFRWAQNATSGTPTTIYANSWLRAQKIA